jgi:hypothetical protein
MSIPSKHELIDFIRGELQRFAAHEVPPPDAVNAELRKVFLRQNSETPDNLGSIANLELGSVAAVDGRQTFGLTVRGTQLLISDVLWRALDTDAGAALIVEKFPQLTKPQAEAVLRMCVVIFSNLEATEIPRGD